MQLGREVMAITIRNKKLEAAIQQIGRESGEGPSAVVGRLVDEEQKRREEERKRERIERGIRVREWLASLPPLTDEDRAEIDRIMKDMYDEDGLPT
jgi:hypothetical protein